MERFEENLGKYPYVNLEQVKDYLSISSNTHDARLSNIITYSTAVIEHYIGQQVLANNYTELFDGGQSVVYTTRLPLNNVYQISEYDGTETKLLNDSTTIGTLVDTSNDDLNLRLKGGEFSQRIKKFGQSSLKLSGNDEYVSSVIVPEHLRFEEDDFTIETFVRVDEASLQDNVIFSINTDSDNYLQFGLSANTGLTFEARVGGVSTTITGSNTNIETQQFTKRRFSHVAVSRNLETERLYLFFNGVEIANSSFSLDNLTFTSNVEIGKNTRASVSGDFKGYIDELKVSNKAKYLESFTVPSFRFRPDNDTTLLLHFDQEKNDKDVKDSHNVPSDYIFNRDSGRISKDTGAAIYGSGRTNYPALSLFGMDKFKPFPNGVEVQYRAGYESGDVPYDLQVATLDYIKLLYKQEQDRSSFSFEGERGSKNKLSMDNFPPHIRRVLDLYRIVF